MVSGPELEGVLRFGQRRQGSPSRDYHLRKEIWTQGGCAEIILIRILSPVRQMGDLYERNWLALLPEVVAVAGLNDEVLRFGDEMNLVIAGCVAHVGGVGKAVLVA